MVALMADRALPRILTVREYGSDPLRALERRGQAKWIRRGAYQWVVPAQEPWERAADEFFSRCFAVADRLTGPFAFSHTSAAGIRRWPVPLNPSQVQIVQPTRPTRIGQGDIVRHYRPDLTADDIVEINGLPVTRDTETVLDNIRQLGPRDGLVVADHALKKLAAVSKFRRPDSLIRQEALRSEWMRALTETGPGRGVRRAREVLRYAEGLSGSPRESRCRWLALVAGLPVPICEWEIWVDGQRLFSDMAWLADGDDWTRSAITFEYDGTGKYGDTAEQAVAAFVHEKDRQDVIESLDVAVHRITKQRLSNTPRAKQWMLSKFPPSVRANLTPRPLLAIPPS